MPAPRYPHDTLPGVSLWSFTPGPNALQSDEEYAHTERRKSGRQEIRTGDAAWTFLEGENNTFQLWYDADLNKGIRRFYIKLPAEHESGFLWHVARFLRKRVVTKGFGYHEVTATLEVYPIVGEPPALIPEWMLGTVAAGVLNSTYITDGAAQSIILDADSAFLVYTTNGLTWATRSIPAGEWKACQYGNGRFVAVTGNNSPASASMYSTDDGVTWTAGGTLPASSYWVGMGFGNGQFCAISYAGIIARSTNGAAWTSHSLGSSGIATWRDVCYAGGGVWLAVRQDSSAVRRSTDDGVTWVAGTALPGALGGGAMYVSADPATGVVLACPTNSNANVAVSTDRGATWTAVAVGLTGRWLKPHKARNLWVLMPNTGGAAGNCAWSEDDGASWNLLALPTSNYYLPGLRGSYYLGLNRPAGSAVRG